MRREKSNPEDSFLKIQSRWSRAIMSGYGRKTGMRVRGAMMLLVERGLWLNSPNFKRRTATYSTEFLRIAGFPVSSPACVRAAAYLAAAGVIRATRKSRAGVHFEMANIPAVSNSRELCEVMDTRRRAALLMVPRVAEAGVPVTVEQAVGMTPEYYPTEGMQWTPEELMAAIWWQLPTHLKATSKGGISYDF